MNRNFVYLFFALFAGLLSGTQTAYGQLYTVSGIVTSSFTGDPVENVYVQAYWNGDPYSGAFDYTDPEGQYSFEITGGTYDVDFQPPPESGLRSKLVEGVVVQDDVNLDVALENAFKIEGYVYDSDGVGIPNIDLNVYDQESGEQLDIGGDDTDPDGYYDIYVPPGIFRIVYRPVFGERYAPVELTNVEVSSDLWIDVVLEDGFFISGTVTGPQGAVQDADIDVEDSQTGIKLYTPGDNTDANGFYQVLVPAGIFNVMVDPPGGQNLAPAIVYDIPVSGDITLNFLLETGYTLSGVVTDPYGVGVFDADTDVSDSQTGLKMFTPRDNTDESGNYQVVVPIGTYDVSVIPQIADRLVPAIEYGFVVSGNTSLDFSVEAGCLLSGTVSDPNSNQVSGADLDVTDVSTGVTLFTPSDNTDDAGYYEVVIPPGLYDIDYRPQVVPPYLAPVRMGNQNITGDAIIDVTAPFGILLSGLIQNSFGAGVENVDIDAKVAVDDTDVPLVGDYTDADGAFTTVLAPGTYHLEIKPPRARRLAAEKFFDQNYNSDTEIFAALDTGMVVSGNISFYDGTPIPDMAVSAALSSNQQQAFTPGNKSDLTGFYEILLAPETYDLTFSPDPLSGLPDTSTVTDIVVDHDMDFDFVYGTAAPVANFTGNPLSGIIPLEVTFTDQSVNEPTSWSWDFGDGGTSFEENPVHIYENSGLFTVSLTVTNEHGSDLKVEIDYIDAFEGGDCGTYVVGDFNGSGLFNVADVVDAYSKLKIGSPAPYLECECPPGSGTVWAVAMDVNNSCSFNVADVVSGYSRLKTGSPELTPCEDCPPGYPLPRYGDERPR